MLVKVGNRVQQIVTGASSPPGANGNSRRKRRDESSHDQHPVIGERHGGRDHYHRVDCRCGQQKSEGSSWRSAGGHQSTCDRHRPALTARQGQSGQPGRWHSENSPLGYQPPDGIRRHVGRDQTADDDPEHKERESLEADRDEQRGPQAQVVVCQESDSAPSQQDHDHQDGQHYRIDGSPDF